MNQKKTFSYIIWFLYSVFLCICLLCIAGTLSVRAGYSGAVGYGVIGLWLVLNGLLVFLIAALSHKSTGVEKSGVTPALIVEGLVVVMIFAVGCFLRVAAVSGAAGGTAYFELAKVAEGQGVPLQGHGAVNLYLYFLHAVFFVFGNHYIAGIWSQLLIQMIVGFCFYRAVRKLSGVLASIVTLGFLMLAPLLRSLASTLSPELLFLMVYAFVFYLCACCIKGRRGPISCLLTGAAVGIVCYLDVLGFSLLPLMLIGLLRTDAEKEYTGSRRLSAGLCVLLGGTGALALLLLGQALWNAQTYAEAFFTWWKIFIPAGFGLPPMLDVANPSLEVLCLLLSMTLGIFSFWCSNDRERQSIWACVMGSVLLIQCFGIPTNEIDGQVYLYIFFAVLSGVGVADIFSARGERGEEVESGDEACKAPAEEKPKSVVIRIPSRSAEDKFAEGNTTEDKSAEDKPAEDKPVEVNPAQVKLIDNPLPLPKKHVKKTMDYDISVDSREDDFDFDVAEDDDFDL